MLYSICIGLILIASVLVILAVLVQNPKSGMAANFGVSNQVMGVRETTNFLEKFTWTMAVAIVVLSLVATLAMDRGLVERVARRGGGAVSVASSGNDYPVRTVLQLSGPVVLCRVLTVRAFPGRCGVRRPGAVRGR